jgi:hypothetical protein
MNENKLSEIFGKPNEGVHKPSIIGLDIATIDTLGTVMLAYGISYYFDKPFLPTLAGTFAVGEIAHVAFGVETRLLKKLKKIG